VLAFWIGAAMLATGTFLLFVGCVRHAQVKGYRWWTGVLAALCDAPGVITLRGLRDRTDTDESGRGFEVIRPIAASTTWVDPDNVGRPPPGPPRSPWNLAASTDELRVLRARPDK
jgi:hypothetical protein